LEPDGYEDMSHMHYYHDNPAPSRDFTDVIFMLLVMQLMRRFNTGFVL